jgi:hypothetical protein
MGTAARVCVQQAQPEATADPGFATGSATLSHPARVTGMTPRVWGAVEAPIDVGSPASGQ